MKIGDKLKKRRIECSYSVSDVAAILGISVDDVRDIENNVKEPTLDQLSVFGKIYMSSIDDLCLPNNRQNYYVRNKRFNKIELYISFIFILITILNFILLAVPFMNRFTEDGYIFLNGYDALFNGFNTVYLVIFILNTVLLLSTIMFVFFDNKFSKYIQFILSAGLIVCLVLRVVELNEFALSNTYYSFGTIAMLVINCLGLLASVALFIYKKIGN